MRILVPLTLAVAIGLATCVVAAPPADKTISVYVDGRLQSFNPAAVVREGKAYVPLRQVGGALGASVKYDPATRMITLVYCGDTIKMPQSEGLTLGGSVFVPLRKVSESFGCTVRYDAAANAARITKPAGG